MSLEIPELESYIGYRLNGLAERNEHHLFEAIAVRIARKRISSNILIAKGPRSSRHERTDGSTGRFSRRSRTWV